jgi:hypothetical protein
VSPPRSALVAARGAVDFLGEPWTAFGRRIDAN